MKILVTGASGFIGRNLCPRLASNGHDVVRAGRGVGPNSDLDIGKIGPTTDWSALLAGGVEAVVHLAARVPEISYRDANPSGEFRAVNVEGTLNLASQAAAAGVRRFVFLSSIKVCGESTQPGIPFSPDCQPRPADAYAQSKYEAERGLLADARESKMEVVIIRPPLVYGPGVKGNFASMIDWVRRGIPLPLGGIKNHRSLVGIDNLVDLVAICCDPERSPQAANEVFLVSDGEDISTPNLLKQVARVFGTRIWLLPIPEGFLKACARMTGRSAAVERLLGNLTVDCSKTQKLLGWYPATTLVEQLRKMAINVADS